MARRRFFVDFIRGGMAELRGDEARHLTRVLRVEPGQRFEITDNEAAYLAEIDEARGERVTFRVVEQLVTPGPPLRITLLPSIVKFDRFEWIVEKATELGVERIIPVDATRTEKGLFDASRKRSERWMRIAREASQQSRRVRVPEIAPALRFTEALRTPAGHRYFLHEATLAPLLGSVPLVRAATDTAALLLGPEGGWTDPECQQAAAAGWLSVSLGPQILRAETAAVAALAVLVNAWMV